MALAYAPGVIVEHSVWGRGKVLENRQALVVVYFPSLGATEAGPRRKVQSSASQLSLAEVQEAPDLAKIRVGPPTPRNKKPTTPKAKKASGTLEAAVAGFRKTYAGLFADPVLLKEELAPKRAAHATFAELFGAGRGRTLLEKGELDAVSKGLHDIYHATTIPSQFEMMAATEGLKDPAAAGRLLEAALNFIDAPGAELFQKLVDAVVSLPAPAKGSRVLTWPNVTLLPFLAAPDRFMVLKPENSRLMAARMGFDLFYTPSPTWRCYEALQRMSAALLKELAPLKAKDYLDVQAFMWVTRELA
jgi:hypothetical protein